jgi:hypothetical protein
MQQSPTQPQGSLHFGGRKWTSNLTLTLERTFETMISSAAVAREKARRHLEHAVLNKNQRTVVGSGGLSDRQ